MLQNAIHAKHILKEDPIIFLINESIHRVGRKVLI